MCRTIRIPGLSASTRNIVAPAGLSPCSGVRAMQIVQAAPSAPVMYHLRPLITQASPSRWAEVLSMDGSDPTPGLGSVIAKQDRTAPPTSGARYLSRCSGVATRFIRCMLPSSGAAQLRASGPSRP